MTTDTAGTALSHLRVLELGGGVAAYASHYLAELGADVIKLEPSGGDAARLEAPFAGDIPDPDRSISFVYFNANKRSIVLDLEKPEGRQSLLDLVAGADVVLEAFAPGYLAGLGIGYDRMRAVNSGVNLVSLTPFGQTGPLRDYKGGNAVAEAMSSLIYGLGDDARAPCASPNDLQSQIAGLHGAFASLGAVFNRRQGGSGQWVDISVQEAGTNMQTGLVAYSQARTIRRRRGTVSATGASGIYHVKDGYIYLQPDQPQMWRALVEWMQDPILAGPEWTDRSYRQQNADVIQSLVTEFLNQFTSEEAIWGGQNIGIPTGPVNTAREMVESPQVESLGSFHQRTHPVVGDYKVIDFARLTETPIRFQRPAPSLGEHQREILEEARQGSRPAAGAAGGATHRRGPLQGMRVLDFTRVIAGPVGTQHLAFLGADIIKVESRDLPGLGREGGSGFPDMNRAKRSITLDVRQPEGHALALRLVAESDVVVDNFSAGVMGRLGLDYDSLRQVKPDIVALSMPGMGRVGPLRDWGTFGQTLQCYIGLVWMWRDPATALQAGVKGAPADFVCAAQETLLVLAALEYRDRTGKGQFIDLVQLEGLSHTVGPIYIDYMVNGRVPEPQGYRSARYAPYGCYPCRGDDAWCVVACETDEEWRVLGQAMGEPGWATEERFATREGRIQHRDELDGLLAGWTQEYTPRQVMHFLQEAGVQAGAAQTAEDLFFDYHLRDRGHVVKVNHPEPWGPLEHQGLTAHFSDTPGDASVPTPAQGQHNDEVFGGLLGLSTEEIQRLQDAKVIY